MKRPDFVTNEDIMRWSDVIDNDKHFPKELLDQPLIKEVCYAGLWLEEELQKLNCPDTLISQIQFTAGKLSFGNDFWKVHIKILDDYINNELSFESDPESNSELN